MTDLVNQVLGDNPYDDEDDEDWDEDDFHPETWALCPEPEDLVA